VIHVKDTVFEEFREIRKGEDKTDGTMERRGGQAQ